VAAREFANLLYATPGGSVVRNTVAEAFQATFDPDSVLKQARGLGAVERLRIIHPAPFVGSLVACAMGDEERSIATARRQYGAITGNTPEESSFYDRFTRPMAHLVQALAREGFATCNRHERRALAAALRGTGLVDVQAIDGTQVTLPADAADEFPSTSDAHGGIKLTATLSVLFQTLDKVTCTDARMHDRKALRLDRWLHGRLLLMDRGYYDHRLFQTIEARKGFFIVPLKTTAKPTIAHIRSGLGQAHVGTRLGEDLPYRGIVDIDVSLALKGGGAYACRAVRVPIVTTDQAGRETRTYVWQVTNLPPEQFSAAQIATLYRLRWEVELAFKTMKTVGRLDQLKSCNRDVILAFLFATLLGIVLTQKLCADMREHWEVEPSFHRVAALTLLYLPRFLIASSKSDKEEAYHNFLTALRREGVNPNPGRSYKHNRYARDVEEMGRSALANERA
jgi:putative transposase